MLPSPKQERLGNILAICPEGSCNRDDVQLGKLSTTLFLWSKEVNLEYMEFIVRHPYACVHASS